MAKKIIQVPFPETLNGMIDMAFIAQAIKSKRTHLGFTQQDAAMYCNVPVGVFTKLEKGNANVLFTSFLSVIDGLGLKIEIKES